MNGYKFDQAYSVGRSLQQKSLASTAEFFEPPVVSPYIIAGVDEVGRGPLAGPVVAAAVILPESPRIAGLRDSKVVPEEQREALYCEILETALATAVAIVPHTVIDSTDILAASLQAMREALAQLETRPDLVLVDGNQKPKSGLREVTIVKGDSKSAAIMAASILAKVTRDQIMIEQHMVYPHYGFHEHKGYACRQHLEAIRQFGPCPIHRMSFEPMKSMYTSPSLELN